MTLRRTTATACAAAVFACVAAADVPAQRPADVPAQRPADAPPAPESTADVFARLSAEESEAEEGAVDRVPMFSTPGLGTRSSSGSASQRSISTADQIRQARAQYRARQRMARIEARKWMGYEPLRPNWNAVPMMTSRHTARRVIQVPVYVPAR